MPAAAKDVTMVKNGIHNPADARHFMRLGEPEYLITATLKGLELAHSNQALKLKEVGFDIYESHYLLSTRRRGHGTFDQERQNHALSA